MLFHTFPVGKFQLTEMRGKLPRPCATIRRVTLTERDAEILQCLTHKVRVFTIPQLARTWWPTSAHAEANAQARIKLLAENGLAERLTILAHPEIELPAPIAIWKVGDPAPNLGAASWALRSRWAKPPIRTQCLVATKRAGIYFGGNGGGRLPRRSEQTHDIHMGALFLQFRELLPELIPYWVSEETLRAESPERGEKVPDAMIRTGDSRRIIEFGGAYPKKKLESFHTYCREKGLPYELW